MRCAVAGTTTIKSAVCPRRVWGMGVAASHSDGWAGADANPENVTAPTKRVASLVRTGITCAPASTKRRHTSTALYAAIPPQTPKTIRGPGLPDACSSLAIRGIRCARRLTCGRVLVLGFEDFNLRVNHRLGFG